MVELIEAGEVRGYTTPEIMQELTQVLAYPRFGLEPEELEARNYYITILTVVMPKFEVNIIRQDPEDNKVLECAVEVGADYVVTGDKHLLKTQEHKGVRIMSAREFLDTVKRKKAS